MLLDTILHSVQEGQTFFHFDHENGFSLFLWVLQQDPDTLLVRTRIFNTRRPLNGWQNQKRMSRLEFQKLLEQKARVGYTLVK